jgi:hypothetical protein
MLSETTFSLFSFVNETCNFSQLTHSDWLNFAGSFGGAILAVGIAYYFNKRTHETIRSEENKNIILTENQNLNKSIVYFASLLESAVMNLDQSILPSYNNEKNLITLLHEIAVGNISTGDENPQTIFTPLRPFDLPNEDYFLSLLPNRDIDNEIFQTFYRAKFHAEQALFFSQGRNEILTYLYHNPEIDEKYIALSQEMFQKTSIMLISGTSMLDGFLHISKCLIKLIEQQKYYLKDHDLEGIKINLLPEVPKHFDLLKKLHNIVDQFPEQKDRLKNITFH